MPSSPKGKSEKEIRRPPRPRRRRSRPPAEPAKPADLITLGGDEYYLDVDLTNRGAGVHRADC